MGAQGIGRTSLTRWTAASALAMAATCGAASSPFAFAEGDLRKAWEESATSFATPSFQDYVTARGEAFRADAGELFSRGAVLAASEGVLGNAGEGRPGHSYAEVKARGGTAYRTDVAGFYGVEVKPMEAALSAGDTRGRSGDGFYSHDYTQADAEISVSDPAGTAVGFGADYEGAGANFREEAMPSLVPLPNSDARSGGAAAFFRSNLWGKAKFATRVSGVFAEGDYARTQAVDNVLTSDSSYDFFWLGENLARGGFAISQENYKYAGRQQGFLTAQLGLENDFPIADRLYLSAGAAGASFRRDKPLYRLYPRGRLLWRVSRGWGYFIHYQPEFRVPEYRELYIRRDYVAPTAFRPVDDKYFALRSGATYNFRSAAEFTGALFENRRRQTYALRDRSPGVASYYDPGRTRFRGADFSYRLKWSRYEHDAGFTYTDAVAAATPGEHFPYLPAYTGTAAFTVNFGGGHAAWADVVFVGKRYAEPEATAALAPAWVPGAAALIHVGAGVGVLVAVENLTDTRYYEPGGILASRRSLQAGVNVKF